MNEVHASPSLPSLNLSTPTTPFKCYITPRKTPEEFNNMISTIESITAEINEYAEKNMKNRQEFSKLIKDMEAITKALNHNIDISEEVNRNIEAENQQIQEYIDRQEQLKDQLIESYYNYCQRGVDLRKYKNINYDFLVSLAGEDFPRKTVDTNIQLRKIAKSEPYFEGCRTNKDFLERCKQLLNDTASVNPYIIPKTKGLSYQEKISKLQLYHDQVHAKLANELKRLSSERDNYLKQIKEIKDQRRRGWRFRSGAQNTISDLDSSIRLSHLV